MNKTGPIELFPSLWTNLILAIITLLGSMCMLGLLVFAIWFIGEIMEDMNAGDLNVVIVAALVLAMVLMLSYSLVFMLFGVDYAKNFLKAKYHIPLMVIYQDRFEYYDTLTYRCKMGKGSVDMFKKRAYRVSQDQYHTISFSDVSEFKLERYANEPLRVVYKQDLKHSTKIDVDALKCRRKDLLEMLNTKLEVQR